MAKKPTKQGVESIDLDGDEQLAGATGSASAPTDTEGTGEASGTPIDDADAPTHPAFLDGPKTLPTAGDGTGGRPWVYSDGVMRRERQGDESRPRCPGCTRDDVAVLCKATSSREVTRYRCECCKSFRTEKLRPAIAAQMRTGSFTPQNKAPFVERP